MADIIKSNAEVEESLNAPAEDIVGDGVILGDPDDGSDSGDGSGTEPTSGDDNNTDNGDGNENADSDEDAVEPTGVDAAYAIHGWGDTGNWLDPVIPGESEDDDDWYDKVEPVRPRVYHKKAKESLFEHLYPDLVEEKENEDGGDDNGEGGDPNPEQPSTDPNGENTDNDTPGGEG